MRRREQVKNVIERRNLAHFREVLRLVRLAPHVAQDDTHKKFWCMKKIAFLKEIFRFLRKEL